MNARTKTQIPCISDRQFDAYTIVFGIRNVTHIDKALAEAHEARLVTTEKDWVRLDAEARRDVLAWPVSAVFANPAALDGLLRDVLDAANADR